MIHKKILVLVLCTLVLSPLYAGPGEGWRPQSAWEAIERHEQGEIITEVSLFSGGIPAIFNEEVHH